MEKKVHKKKPTKAQRLAKVKRALKKFVPWDGEPLTIQKAVRVGGFDDGVLLYLGGGKWTLSKAGRIDGVVGGFNGMALSVASGLREVGVLTHPDIAAFDEWFSNERKKNASDYDLERAREIAERHGFVLTKKPRSKAA